MMFSTMRLLLALVGTTAAVGFGDASALTTLVGARSHSNLSPEEFRDLMEGHHGRELEDDLNSEACALCAVNLSFDSVSGVSCYILIGRREGKL